MSFRNIITACIHNMKEYASNLIIFMFLFENYALSCRQMKDTVLYIKNMVCDRCKMAVEHELRNLGLTPIKVELGVVCVKEEVDSECRAKIRAGLEALGFELLEDRQQQTVDRIKSLIIELVHYRNNRSGTNLSAYLSEQLGSDYSALSKLFQKTQA